MEYEVSQRGLWWSWQPRKRRREALDVFFEEGDRVCYMGSRPVVVELEGGQDLNRLPEFICGISGCSEVFDTISGYEVHYNSAHRHTCSACHRTLPSNLMLETHLRETHDPLFELTAGNKFTCLVEGCESRFASEKSRRNHLIKTHKYPASFRFHRATHSLKTPGLQPSETTTSVKQPLERTIPDLTTNEAGSMDVSENTANQRKPLRVFSYKVPQSISFGHGSSRGFHRPGGRRRGKHWHQTKMDVDTSVQIENVNMADLKDALSNQ